MQKGIEIKKGSMIDTKGNLLGHHQGICFYTIGQREGLGVALGERAYVININIRKNTITLGKESDLYSDGLIAKEINFLSIDEPKRPIRAKAKIRYGSKEVFCQIFCYPVHLVFKDPYYQG